MDLLQVVLLRGGDLGRVAGLLQAQQKEREAAEENNRMQQVHWAGVYKV